MNDLAALLAQGGAAPAAPLPSGPDPSLQGAADPSLQGVGAPPVGPVDPSQMGAGGMPPMPGAPQSPFPSTDPNAVNSILEQLLMMQQNDQGALKQQQMQTLAGDPLLQALMGGAPVGPGTGQDAQAIGSMGDVAPDPNIPA